MVNKTFLLTSFILNILLTILLSIILTAKYNGSKISEDEQVVIHITTFSKRVNTDFFEKIVRHLLKYEKLDQLIVSLHKDNKDTINWYSENNLEFEKLYFNFLETDYGAATKYIGLLDLPVNYKQKYHIGEKRNADTYFIILDDDILYTYEHLDGLVNYIRTYSTVDGVASRTFYVNTFRGYLGNIFRNSFFKPAMKEMLTDQCKYVDDNWLTIYYKSKKNALTIKTYRVSDVKATRHKNFGHSDPTALRTSTNRKKLQKECRMSLRKSYKIPISYNW